MKNPIPILRPQKIISVLESNGFQRKKSSGGHAVYKHPDSRRVDVPIHGKRDIGKGLFSKMLKSSRKGLKEFL